MLVTKQAVAGFIDERTFLPRFPLLPEDPSGAPRFLLDPPDIVIAMWVLIRYNCIATALEVKGIKQSSQVRIAELGLELREMITRGLSHQERVLKWF